MKKLSEEISNKSFSKNILLITKFRYNLIGAEGVKELAQGLKTFINLSSLTIGLK